MPPQVWEHASAALHPTLQATLGEDAGFLGMRVTQPWSLPGSGVSVSLRPQFLYPS